MIFPRANLDYAYTFQSVLAAMNPASAGLVCASEAGGVVIILGLATRGIAAQSSACLRVPEDAQ
jgi:hypothetical protein